MNDFDLKERDAAAVMNMYDGLNLQSSLMSIVKNRLFSGHTSQSISNERE
jgi:hypothetical protein